jgi:hypothetical protein
MDELLGSAIEIGTDAAGMLLEAEINDASATGAPVPTGNQVATTTKAKTSNNTLILIGVGAVVFASVLAFGFAARSR